MGNKTRYSPMQAVEAAKAQLNVLARTDTNLTALVASGGSDANDARFKHHMMRLCEQRQHKLRSVQKGYRVI